MPEDRCQLEGTRVLVVNPDTTYTETLTEALNGVGYNVQHVETGAEGLSMAGLFKPEVVVTALIMESHDAGFVLAEALQRNPLTSHIHILMITKNHEETGFSFTQEKDGKWMRTDRYFERPVEVSEIIQAVGELTALKENAQ